MSVQEAVSYTYSSSPKPIKPRKKAAEDEEYMPINIMADPRVFRGSMYSIARAIEQEQEQEQQQKQHTAKRQATPVAPVTEVPKPWYSFAPASYAGAVDVSKYLEEQPRVAVVTAAESQTDEFKAAPEPAPYVPRKTGIDASTSIEDQSELFVFDEEVKPLVEVLVWKTLEQAQFELEAEAELAAIEQAMTEHRHRREQEAAQILRREQETIQEFQKLQATKKTEQDRVKRQLAASEKLACVQCARFLYTHGLKDALTNIHKSGVWTKPQRDVVQEYMMSEVIQSAQTQFEQQMAATTMMQELLEHMVSVFASRRAGDWLDRVAPPSKMVLRIKVTASGGVTQVGSIELNMDDTVETAERRIQEYITNQGVEVVTPENGYLSVALKQQLVSTCLLSEINIPDALDLAL